VTAVGLKLTLSEREVVELKQPDILGRNAGAHKTDLRLRGAERRLAMAKGSNLKSETTISGDLSQERMEKVRQRAYELYEARGREEGHDLDDWLQAEAEIEALKARTTKMA
jgi:hypothetical protein